MTPTITEISKELNIPTKKFAPLAILTYLEHELRLAEEEIADIRDKYLVASKEKFEEKIKNRKIYSHPAWEDLITWENLENYIRKIKKTIQKIQ